MKIVRSRRINAPLETVWKIASGWSSVADWNPEMMNVRLTSEQANGIGATRLADHASLDEPFAIEQTIVEWDEQVGFSYTTRVLSAGVPFENVTTDVLFSTEGGACVVTMVFRFDLSPGTPKEAGGVIADSMEKTLGYLCDTAT